MPCVRPPINNNNNEHLARLTVLTLKAHKIDRTDEQKSGPAGKVCKCEDSLNDRWGTDQRSIN